MNDSIRNDTLIGETKPEFQPTTPLVAELIRITNERHRQIAKWGTQHYDDGKWLWVLMEEVGEAAQELNDQPNGADRVVRRAFLERLRTELNQVATVCVAWNERLTDRINALS